MSFVPEMISSNSVTVDFRVSCTRSKDSVRSSWFYGSIGIPTPNSVIVKVSCISFVDFAREVQLCRMVGLLVTHPTLTASNLSGSLFFLSGAIAEAGDFLTLQTFSGMSYLNRRGKVNLLVS